MMEHISVAAITTNTKKQNKINNEISHTIDTIFAVFMENVTESPHPHMHESGF